MTLEKGVNSMEARRLYWLKMLRWGALVVLVTGLLPSLAVSASFQEPWRLFFDVLAWPMDGYPSGFSSSDRQISAVLGGVLCGWAWLIFRLAQPGVFTPDIRKILVQSTWVWFVLDSGGSIFAGLPLNAISNLFFLAILILPLSRLKNIS